MHQSRYFLIAALSERISLLSVSLRGCGNGKIFILYNVSGVLSFGLSPSSPFQSRSYGVTPTRFLYLITILSRAYPPSAFPRLARLAWAARCRRGCVMRGQRRPTGSAIEPDILGMIVHSPAGRPLFLPRPSGCIPRTRRGELHHRKQEQAISARAPAVLTDNERLDPSSPPPPSLICFPRYLPGLG
jgi:hypothetical protein